MNNTKRLASAVFSLIALLIATSSLAAIPDLPEAVTSFGAASDGRYLYVYGGHKGKPHKYWVGTTSGRFHRIDLSSPTAWEELPSGPAAQGLGMAAHDGKIYRVGGMSPRNTEGEPEDLLSSRGVARFDPAKGTWEELTPLPEPRSSFDAVVLDGKLYVVGGWVLAGGAGSEGKWHAHGLVADLAHEPLRWERLPDQPFSQRALALAGAGGKVYAIGGMTDDDGTCAKTFTFDVASKTWSPGPDLPIPHRMKGFGVAAQTLHGAVYASGITGTLYRLDPATSAWRETGITHARPRIFHRLVPDRAGNLLVLGGASSGSIINTVESVSLAKDEPRAAGSTRWPGFRGRGDSHADARDLPLTWSETDNIAWRTSLPGYGQSSPVVWDGKVFVTSVEGESKEKLNVHCLDLRDGRLLWSKQFPGTQKIPFSDMVSKGAPTPAVDDRHVYALFESGDLVALTHAGETVWHRKLTDEYGPIQGNHGLGSSVALTSDSVVVLVDHAADGYLVSINQRDGTNRWKLDRPKRVSWTTPLVTRDSGVEEILISSNGVVESFDARDGRRRWWVDGVAKNTLNSPTLAGDLVVAGSSDATGLLAFRRNGDGDVSKTHLAWKGDAPPSDFASPLFHGGQVYALGKGGLLTCVSIADGRKLWSTRLDGDTWASPIAAGDRLYFFSHNGTTTVLRPSADGPAVLATNTLPTQGRVYGVAALDGAFVIRTGSELIRVGTPAK